MNCILLPAAASNVAPTVMDSLANSSYIESYTLTDMRQVTHINKVLGAKVGDCIKVGIKSGRLGTAVIKQIDNHHIELAQVECSILPPVKLDLTVVLALCRPKVLRRLIMDMTAIGVKRIVLVNSYRTQKSYWQSPMLERLDEFVDEGLSQSIDTVAPIIERHTRFKPFVEDVLSQWTHTSGKHSAIVAHPYASISFDDYLHHVYLQGVEQTGGHRQQHSISDALPQIICIGAEGGWIEYEVELLQANGCTPVTLGRRILRTEAVVNALCGRYMG